MPSNGPLVITASHQNLTGPFFTCVCVLFYPQASATTSASATSTSSSNGGSASANAEAKAVSDGSGLAKPVSVANADVDLTATLNEVNAKVKAAAEVRLQCLLLGCLAITDIESHVPAMPERLCEGVCMVPGCAPTGLECRITRHGSASPGFNKPVSTMTDITRTV